jgi:hypothetical protein
MRTSLLVSTSLAVSARGGAAQPVAEPEAPIAQAPAPAPAQVSAEAPPVLSQAEAQDKALVDYGAAWEAGDAQNAATFFASDGVVKMAGAPDAAGADAIAGSIGAALGAAKDGKFPFVRTFTVGNAALSRARPAAPASGPAASTGTGIDRPSR